MKQKLLICALNSKYIHSSLAPWCLYAGIKAYGNADIDAKVFESTVNRSLADIKDEICRNKPQIISFCTYIWNINYIKELLPLIKAELSHVKIILGGPEVSFNPVEVMNSLPEVDFILCGEGEESFPALINSICESSSYENVSGLCTKAGNTLIQNGIAQNKLQPPSPYCKEYFDALGGRISYIETSRGCPFSCAFCLSGAYSKLKFFPLDEVKKEIVALSNSGTKTVKFVDRTFNANPKRALEIVNFIVNSKEIPPHICFHFEIAGDILSEELILAFNNAPKGRFQLEIGLQSFNEKTLEAVNRKTDTKKLIKNIKRLISPQNIHVHIDLIAGLPLENKESFYKGLDMAYELKPHMLQMGFLKILHGSDMGQNRKKYPCEYSNTAPYMIKSTPYLSESDLDELLDVEDALDRLYNSGRFKHSLEFAINSLNMPLHKLLLHCTGYLGGENLSLDAYTERLFIALSALLDKGALRDLLIIDRLSTNASGKIPNCLQISDENLRKAKQFVTKQKPLKKGVKRTVALLYTKNKIVYCDYENKDLVTDEFTLKFLDIPKTWD